jgi:dATP pyrophosphohydrolase
MRAPLQVIVIPFRRVSAEVEYAVLQRSDAGWWHFVSGGAEDQESPRDAALRETREEVGHDATGKLIPLDHRACIPKDVYSAAARWSPDLYVIPEYYFAFDVGSAQLRLSAEHTDLRWLGYKGAQDLLHWESNRTGLWELRERLTRAQTDPAALRRV